MKLVADSVVYFSQGDEDAFFRWIEAIPGIGEVVGKGTELHLELRGAGLSEPDLREVLALFNRYDIDMAQLSALLTDENAAWFSDPTMYWHARVFPAGV